jgi:hypothetical protein
MSQSGLPPCINEIENPLTSFSLHEQRIRNEISWKAEQDRNPNASFLINHLRGGVMKTITHSLFFAAVLVVMLAIPLYGQNGSINNTLGTGGAFSVKDGSATFLTLSQSTGYLGLNKSLTLPATTDATLGVIFKGGDRFIHNYQAPGLVGGNTFVGVDAGNFVLTGYHNSAFGESSLAANTTGFSNSAFGYGSLSANTAGFTNCAFGVSSLPSNTTGAANSAFGYFSLFNNTTGGQNSAFGSNSLDANTTGSCSSAFGYYSLHSNTTGQMNSAFGYSSLFANTTGELNSGFGYSSLHSNTTGQMNSAFGENSLAANTTGNHNSAFGLQSIYDNTTGSNNSAFGMNSLCYNTTGDDNSAFGYYSLFNNTAGGNNSAFGRQSLENARGNDNTALGYKAGSTITTGSNNIAVGANAQVPVGASDNQVRIGNSSITYAGVEVAWTITSDRRRKQNIESLNSGLDFVSMLRPVSYTRKNDQKHRTEYGFIAQEVEQVLKDQGIQNSGMLTIDDKGFYELRYNDLFAPVVKAIQELKSENDALRSENNMMKKELSSLRVTVMEQVKEMRSILLKIAQAGTTPGKAPSHAGTN